MRISKLVTGLFVLSLVVAMAVPAHALIMIDDFTGTSNPDGGWSLEPSGTPVDTTNSVSLSETGITGAFSGNRYTTVSTSPVWKSYSSYTGWANGRVSGDLWTGTYEGKSGFLMLSSSFGGYGTITTEYSYDNLDLSTGSQFTIALDPDHLGFGKDSVVGITLTDTFGATSTVSQTWASGTNLYPDDYLNINLSLSSFIGVDLASISDVLFSYEADLANDISIDFISVDATPTPIPGAVWLLGSGLVGLVGLRRKKKS